MEFKMKTISVLSIFFFALNSWSQSAAIKDIPVDGDTTISIKKGDQTKTEFEVVTDQAQISGEPEILSKAARASWTKACAEWKKETRELNKDNQVLALNCGLPKCVKTDMTETVCTSDASYKLRVKVR